ncbi:hypothetical protein RHCRD62_70316 [Rhodococcus sp. RD6.2]|nr:hypothetical protein RHCRD62_70316 [Rhodococcus sp. RD6.2]
MRRPGPRGGGRVRPPRHPGQQRGRDTCRGRHSRTSRGLPKRARRQPVRRVLDGTGVCPGDATGFEHRQRRQHARSGEIRTATGCVRVEQGRAHRPHPRPVQPVVRTEGHPGQRHRTRLRGDRHDRRDAGGHPGTVRRRILTRPDRDAARDRRCGGVPGESRFRLRHRIDPRGRRRHVRALIPRKGADR